MNGAPTLALPRSASSARFSLGLATAAESETIFRLRHDVYARELGQHAVNGAGRLREALDAYTINLVARLDGAIAGFISLTHPAAARSRSINISRAIHCPRDR